MRSVFAVIGFAVVIVLVLFFSGCTGGGIKDCGSDVQCFGEAAQVCMPAKLTNVMGEMTIKAEIKYGTSQQCTIYYEFEGSSFSGTNMTCTFHEQIQPTSVFDMEEMCDMCTGSFLEGMCA